MKRTYGLVASAVILLSVIYPTQTLAGGCSAAGHGVISWSKETFTTKNAYDISAHFSGVGNSLAGTGINTVNGMMFELAVFFSDKQNVDDFTKGRAALEDIATANRKQGVNLGSAGFYGRKAGFTAQELSELGLTGN